jgi:hypothetical protein
MPAEQQWMDDERLQQPDGANGWIAQSWIYHRLGILFVPGQAGRG